MAKKAWSEDNLKDVLQDILNESADPVAAADFRKNLTDPAFAKDEVAKRIEKPGDEADWAKRIFAFQDETVEGETISIGSLPLAVGDTDLSAKMICSYNRKY